jgi:hypothetical protein
MGIGTSCHFLSLFSHSLEGCISLYFGFFFAAFSFLSSGVVERQACHITYDRTRELLWGIGWISGKWESDGGWL